MTATNSTTSTGSTGTTLLLGGRVYTPAARNATAMAVVDGRIAWVGTDDHGRARFADTAREILALDGALVTPAFVDTHVHATSTGLLLEGLDLTGCRSLAECLRAVTEYAATRKAAGRDGGVLWGHGWDETRWPERRPPTRDELNAAVRGRPAYLSRIDVHSAVVSTPLAEAAAGTDGYSPAGPVSRHAHHAVRRAAQATLTPAQRQAVQRTFLAHAAANGIGWVHECAGPDISSTDDIRDLLAPSVSGQGESGPVVTGYWGEPVGDADQARELLASTGAAGLAGDLFCDGAIGSRTAALREPYTDVPNTSGHAYLDTDAIAAHVVACTEAGVQAGFHVIGDAATQAVVAGFAMAAERVGAAALAADGHRLEHLEMVDREQATALASWGVTASMQPGFDAAWGGPDGMYVSRLGAARAEPMNPFAMLAEVGVQLAFSSDTPVTPVGPWAAVRAAARHRTAGSAIPVAAAVAAHTNGGHHAGRRTEPGAGTLTPGRPASYAVWDGTGPLDADGLPDLDGELPRCRRTAIAGRVIHDRDGGGR